MKQATDSLSLLTELSNAHSVPGREDEVRAIFKENLSKIGNIKIDSMGNIYCERKNQDLPLIAVDCHMDEVGFMVQSITPEGFLKVLGLGGWSTLNLSAQPVVVFTQTGKIPGVFGSVPPHFLKGVDKGLPKIEDLSIDIGATSAAEVKEWGVRPGSFVCPDVQLRATNNPKRLLGKAFDNRVGCGICIESALETKDLDLNATFVGSVQEEGGLKGAKISSNVASPDVAIILEGTPADDTPGTKSATSQSILGSGVQIRCYDPTHLANSKLVDWVIDLAEQQDIPHQIAVRRSGGTDAGSYHLSGSGIPCIVLGVPSRYIHSHQSVIDVDDYHATKTLCVAILKEFNHQALKEILPS